MNEMRLEPDNNAQPPPSAPGQEPPSDGKSGNGSIALGFGLAWLIVVGGHVLLLSRSALALLFLPELATIILAIVFAVQGKSRTAIGIGIGLATMVGVVLLLIAACFGLMSNGNFMR